MPYADTFVVDTKWVFEQGVSGVSNMGVSVDVVFLKSCWVKGMIMASSVRLCAFLSFLFPGIVFVKFVVSCMFSLIRE